MFILTFYIRITEASMGVKPYAKGGPIEIRLYIPEDLQPLALLTAWMPVIG